MKSLIKEKGFTLIELLVVIAVIGIIAGILFVAIDPGGQIDKATANRVQKEMSGLARVIEIAKANSINTLRDITNSGCSDCHCRSGNAQTVSCLNRMEDSWGKVYAAAGFDFSKTPVDPWGTPYMFDENERSITCTKDTMRSFGPDGQGWSSDDIYLNGSPYLPFGWASGCQN